MHVDLCDRLHVDYGEFSYCGDLGINRVLIVIDWNTWVDGMWFVVTLGRYCEEGVWSWVLCVLGAVHVLRNEEVLN